MATTNNGSHAHPRSTVQIAGHPVHPMLVQFPIVCFILAFVCDLLFTQGRTELATASKWLLLIGLVMAALAAVAGLTDFLGDKRIQGSDAIKHAVANVTAVVLELINLLLRRGSDAFIGSTGVWISLVVVLILLYSGWMGGKLVYRHGIGVSDTTP